VKNHSEKLDLTATPNIRDKVCMVTGATNGLGRAVAEGLARLGAEVILLGRNPEKCRSVARAIADDCGGRVPDTLLCDLSSRREIGRAASEFLSWGRPLHLLVNNAGIVNLKRRENADGIEMTLAVNYLAYFQLTLCLLQRMQESAPARIVNVASDAHRSVSLNLDDLESTNRYSVMRAYGLSKLAILSFTWELARRIEGTGVTVNAVDPGPVASGIGSNNPGLAYSLASLMIKYLFPSPKRAARTALCLATSPQVAHQSGAYYKFGTRRTPRADATDAALASRLWEMSVRMTGVDLPTTCRDRDN
jgi:retinol dehydrogenase-12